MKSLPLSFLTVWLLVYSLLSSSVVYRLMDTRSGLAFQPHYGMHSQGFRRSAITLGTGYLSHMALRGCSLVGSVSFLREEKKLGGDPGEFPSSGVCFLSKSR